MKVLILSLIVLLTSSESLKVASQKNIVVLELFTSQGCSSCPPADKLLKNVKENFDPYEVLVLSYHVDYWNYIGWKDPFSKVEFSDLQRSYGKKFNGSTIYTPQIVVNGQEHFVGSNEGILKSKIKEYASKNTTNAVSIFNIENNGSSITFNYTIRGDVSKKNLRVTLVIDEHTTSITKGENRNRKLINSNIVVEQIEIKLNSATGTGTIKIPEVVTKSDRLSLILLIETPDLDVVGGSQVNL